MIVLLGSQKGGCGKSTLAVNIASLLAQNGKDVCLVDADRQGSASDWLEYRDDTEASVIHGVAKFGSVSSTLKDLDSRYEYVICDVAGRDSKELRSAMMAAHVLVAPLRPSQLDINTIPHLTEVFSQAKEFNPELRGLLVLNMCPTHAMIKEADEASEYLLDVSEFKLASTRIHDRKAYRDSFCDGLGVIDGKNEKASTEISQLVREILQ